ncbi:MAG: hypothetical protein U1E01_16245, partial [Methylicorpusculum sp.]|nr:hypothetical protein [Methylicorpusculum sp.]
GMKQLIQRLEGVQRLDCQVSAHGLPPSSLHGRIHGVLSGESPNPTNSSACGSYFMLIPKPI